MSLINYIGKTPNKNSQALTKSDINVIDKNILGCTLMNCTDKLDKTQESDSIRYRFRYQNLRS